MPDRPIFKSSARQLTAFSTALGSNGERLPIKAIVPRELCNADAIAALIEEAALQAGATFPDFLKLVAAAAPPVGVFSIRRPPLEEDGPRRKPGAPAYDWRECYGKSASWLGLYAATGVALRPKLQWRAALRETLRAARKGYSHDKYKEDAERLRQALRRNPTNIIGWRRDYRADRHFPSDLWKMFTLDLAI